jgi:hypothetical protein
VKLTVTCFSEDMETYLKMVVLPQISEGYTSGHTDRHTHWDTSNAAYAVGCSPCGGGTRIGHRYRRSLQLLRQTNRRIESQLP